MKQHPTRDVSRLNARLAAGSARAPAPDASASARWRVRCFRLAALLIAPVAALALAESGLRIGGYGYPTPFLLRDSREGRSFLVQNNQFGWRFFGPQMSRLPYPCSIPLPKPPGTIRVFVLGESAAKGEPQPWFGLPRMLQSILTLRYPSARFEVVNAAMTAINSHAVRSIANDCAGADGDIWVVYMGNNEVVGPFGAGTVFGTQSPPLPLIRLTLALKSTRTGQLLDALRRRVLLRPGESREWGGMQMFLAQQVAANDPGLQKVYAHFEQNLSDILDAGKKHGCGIVLSTVAVNLKDCAPFASIHAPQLAPVELAEWNSLYQHGIVAYDAGNLQHADASFQKAAQIDARYAELRFRQGQCALRLGRVADAQREFETARDLDALRFRCDGRLNELIRQVAAGYGQSQSPRILLADAERVFAAEGSDRPPGDEFFYEHVHLNFHGNYILAKTLALEIEKLLPAQIRASANPQAPWPSAADCARLLGWSDWTEAAVLKTILARRNQPPFTAQCNHEDQARRLKSALQKLASASQPSGLLRARAQCEQALASAPDDPALLLQSSMLMELTGDFAGAAEFARREVKLLPSDPAGWLQLGSALENQQLPHKAGFAFQNAFRLDPQNAQALDHYGLSLAAMGRLDEAADSFRHALELQADYGLAWLHLGQVLERKGARSDAEHCLRQALTNRGSRLPDLVELAGFFQKQGNFEAAADLFVQCTLLDGSDPMLFVAAAQNLIVTGRIADAQRNSAEAVRLAPDFAEARLMHGTILGQAGNVAEAAEQFRHALRIKPELLEARLNLGIALIKLNRIREGREQFEEILRLDPANVHARKYLQALPD